MPVSHRSEPTYEGLKRVPKARTSVRMKSSEPTYEGLKPFLSDFVAGMMLIVRSLPMRD